MELFVPMRPLQLTIDQVREICDRLAGGETVYGVFKDGNEYGCKKTAFYQKINNDKVLYGIYARARLNQTEALFDEIMEIAETETDLKRAEIKIDARKWTIGKIKPWRFGPDPEGYKAPEEMPEGHYFDPRTMTREEFDIYRDFIGRRKQTLQKGDNDAE